MGLLGQEWKISVVKGDATRLLKRNDRCVHYQGEYRTHHYCSINDNKMNTKFTCQTVEFKGMSLEVMRGTVKVRRKAHHLLVVYPNPGPDSHGGDYTGRMSGYLLNKRKYGKYITSDLLDVIWPPRDQRQSVTHDGTYHAGN